MIIPIDQLQAFLAVYERGSFTAGAKALGLTQSAVSQKIARLEALLHAGLLIRQHRSLALTAAGEKLLIHARTQLQLEQDFIRGFNQYGAMASGVYRLAGFSSINRSILIPRLASWLRRHPMVSLELSSHEVINLVGLLRTNQADAVVLDYFPQLPDLEEVKIGEEEYVLIEGTHHPEIPDRYLDHGAHDNATESFFKAMGRKKPFQRAFMGDVYSILDGVAQGLGRAVMSKHLVEGDKRFRILPQPRRYFRPLVLCYYRQAYYGPIHRKIEALLTSS